MKALLAVYLVMLLTQVQAQVRPDEKDPFAQHLFSPELILQYQEEIHLTDKQREAVISVVEELQHVAPRLKAQSEAQRDKLATLLAKPKVDEQAVIAELEKLQQEQAKQARMHIQMMLQLKNQLDSQQQASLNEYKKKGPAQYPPEALKQKLQLLEAGVRDWVGSGRDPSPLSELMQDFEPLIRKGKLNEADALITRALKLIEQ